MKIVRQKRKDYVQRDLKLWLHLGTKLETAVKKVAKAKIAKLNADARLVDALENARAINEERVIAGSRLRDE